MFWSVNIINSVVNKKQKTGKIFCPTKWMINFKCFNIYQVNKNDIEQYICSYITPNHQALCAGKLPLVLIYCSCTRFPLSQIKQVCFACAGGRLKAHLPKVFLKVTQGCGYMGGPLNLSPEPIHVSTLGFWLVRCRCTIWHVRINK